tara:strand:- start:80 stop:499 length:420 start_codon:yes stop_codon:yes gene_type:complete
MTNSNYDNSQVQKNYRNNENNNSNFRNRYGGKRETGGFRIRLSDNEMKSVKNIQDMFQLKSTVAVLGFSVRTLSELIQNENLKEEIIKIAKNNKNSFQKENNLDKREVTSSKTPNPFARPEKKPIIEENKNSKDSLDEK